MGKTEKAAPSALLVGLYNKYFHQLHLEYESRLLNDLIRAQKEYG